MRDGLGKNTAVIAAQKSRSRPKFFFSGGTGYLLPVEKKGVCMRRLKLSSTPGLKRKVDMSRGHEGSSNENSETTLDDPMSFRRFTHDHTCPPFRKRRSFPQNNYSGNDPIPSSRSTGGKRKNFVVDVIGGSEEMVVIKVLVNKAKHPRRNRS